MHRQISVGQTIIVAAILFFVGAALSAWILLVHQQTSDRISVTYPEGVAAIVPLGFSAGGGPALSVSTDNPLANDPNAVQEGKKLFLSMNCAGCHGYNAKGNMGPDLTDAYWRYGGTPLQIYKSIYEGRPKGMPAWGNSLPPTSLWQLVAYLQSLGGTASPNPAFPVKQAGEYDEGRGGGAD